MEQVNKLLKARQARFKTIPNTRRIVRQIPTTTVVKKVVRQIPTPVAKSKPKPKKKKKVKK